MSCKSCKKPSEFKPRKNVLNEKQTTGVKIRNYFFNTLLFLILTLIIVPIAVPAIIYILFKSIVLEQSINIFPFLVYISKKIATKYGEEDDEEENEEGEDFDEENYDYELENPNDIVEIKSK